MKHRIFSLLLAGALITLSVNVSAVGTEHHWYCKRTSSNAPPPLPPEMSFIRSHNGYYLDEDAREDDKVIYLTFDAGYANEHLERILDVLSDHDATSAFFIVSHLVSSRPELVKRLADEGHTVCNHTAKHPNMAKITDKDAFRTEIESLETLYRETIGEEIARFYRPPEGSFTEENLKMANEMGYATIFWSFAYADWDESKQPSPDEAIELILRNTHNGMVILLHPISKTNADILDRLLSEWESQGYRFGTLAELVKAK